MTAPGAVRLPDEVDVVIVGGGTAGAAAAAAFAARGARTLCVDRRDLTEAGARWVNGVPRRLLAEARRWRRRQTASTRFMARVHRSAARTSRGYSPLSAWTAPICATARTSGHVIVGARRTARSRAASIAGEIRGSS